MPAKRGSGFTLIEVLIAMTLLGIMVTLLFASLRMAAESWNAGEHKIVAVNRKAVVYQFFKRHLTTIRPLAEQQAETETGQPNPFAQHANRREVFQGQSRRLHFVAALPAASARKGLQVFDIAADPAETSTLQVSLAPYPAGEAGGEEAVTLLEGVERYAFSYFGKKNDAEAAWYDDWQDIDRLPALIKVEIQLNDGSFWPEMVFALKIDTQPFNLISPPGQGLVP